MSENRDQGFGQRLYEAIMVILAILSVGTIWYETEVSGYIIWTTWALFTLDYAFRFFRAEQKWEFVKSHPFLLIAIIPADAIFQFARLARIIHLFRLKTITKFYTMPLIRYLSRQHQYYVWGGILILYICFVLWVWGIEPPADSLWTSALSVLMALVMFGRSNIEPVTVLGQGTMVVLSLFGVILYGLILTYVFEHISVRYWKNKVKKWFPFN